jgi:hypothetical protein
MPSTIPGASRSARGRRVLLVIVAAITVVTPMLSMALPGRARRTTRVYPRQAARGDRALAAIALGAARWCACRPPVTDAAMAMGGYLACA